MHIQKRITNLPISYKPSPQSAERTSRLPSSRSKQHCCWCSISSSRSGQTKCEALGPCKYLSLYFHRSSLKLFRRNTGLPFPLIAEVVGDGCDKRRCSYYTRPDFALLKDGLPSFIANFDSKSNRKDCYKLRVQLACSLRLGLFLRGETSSEQGHYFLMGAFLSRQWEILRLFCYVDAQGNVRLLTYLSPPVLSIIYWSARSASLRSSTRLATFCNW